MGPKKKGGEKAKKAQDKAKTDAKKKVVEDKTFGMKNKNKSVKVQKYIQTQFQNVQSGQKKKAADPEQAKKQKKLLEQQRKKELDDLFKVAFKQPKVPVGVDPKSILCEAFKHGACTKGFKCKFSHDINIGRKGPKIDLFSDRRDENEGMENWDQEQLESVVEQKHGQENNKANKTNIVCKYFLEAVENSHYGWFWKCPNGEGCIYRHALPPGYVLKSQMKELLAAEQEKRPDVAEAIEEERKKVEAITRITAEVFKEWHRKRHEAKIQEREKTEADRRKKGLLNGREIFLQAGFVAVDDASASDVYQREVDDNAEIAEMKQKAEEEYARARVQAGDCSEDEAGPSAGPSSSGAGPSTTLNLNEEEEQLFLDDDDDDDLGDDELDEIAAQIAGGKTG